MSEHARFPPSSAHQWLECPGSWAASLNYPDPDSEASREGTRAHALAEACLSAGITSARDILARFGVTGFQGADVTQELAEAVEMYATAVLTPPYEGARWLFGAAEVRVTLSADCWGTTDSVALAELSDGALVLVVTDFKYGAGVYVEVDGNPQIAIYAVAALLSLTRADHPNALSADIIAKLHRLREVVVQVVQPRHFQTPKVRRASIPVSGIREWRERVLRGIEVCKQPNAPFVAGEHCTFCKHKPNCATLRDVGFAAARDAFRSLGGNAASPAAVDEVGMVRQPPMPDQLSGDMLAKLLPAIDRFELWARSVRAVALARLIRGGDVPGYKLVQGRSNRRWRNPAEVPESLQLLFGIDPFEEPALVSPAEAARRVAAASGIRTDEANVHLADYVETPPGKLDIAHVTDARPAVVSAVPFSPVTREDLPE